MYHENTRLGESSNDTLDAFNEVNCEPLPTKLVADNVLFVLFHVKFGDCKIDVAAFPINN